MSSITNIIKNIMEFLPNELRSKFDEMNPEEQADFLKKREEAMEIADMGPKNFEIGSGNALMEVDELDESEKEERKDNNSSI